MFKNRKAFPLLLKQKDDRRISILIGARQVGKTTLFKALYEKICAEGKEKGIFLDLDVFTNFEKVSSFESLLNFIKLNGYEVSQKEFFYLFLDEFQRYADLSIIMKNVYDNLKNVKIYASGSSSVKIKSQIQESLAGRKIISVLYPLDFEEFLWFKDEKEAIKQLKNIEKIKGENLQGATSRLKEILNEFIVFGGYPEVALKKTAKEKISVLESIFDLYLKKDLMEYLNIKKIANVKRLIEHLAINHGQKIKYDEICQISSLGYNEVINYLEILKETFLIHISKPFFTNKNKELVKIPKVYFIDSGVRNFFISNFNFPNIRTDSGMLFEGCVLSELLKSKIHSENIKFWQDKNRHEVDILLEDSGKLIPIEAKFKNSIKSEDLVGLKSFSELYKTKENYLINLGLQKKSKEIIFKLPYRLDSVV